MRQRRNVEREGLLFSSCNLSSRFPHNAKWFGFDPRKAAVTQCDHGFKKRSVRTVVRGATHTRGQKLPMVP